MSKPHQPNAVFPQNDAYQHVGDHRSHCTAPAGRQQHALGHAYGANAMHGPVAKFAGSFSRSSELGAISAPCRRPALWRRRQFPQKPSQSWSTPPQIWAVSQPFCPPRENATQPGFPIFLRPTTMGNKSEESTCRLFQRRCWAPSSFFATRPPWCEPAAGAAGRLTRPAPSHRTCAWPSVAWSRCAARVALFSGGADGSYQGAQPVRPPAATPSLLSKASCC
jgi:hypothetical protein